MHVWFLGNSIVATVFAVFALRELGMPAWAYGIAVAVGGVGGFLGAITAPAVGERIGAGRAILVGRSLTVVPWLLLAVVPLSSATTMTVLLVIVSIAQFLFGLAMGVEDANDISYRQASAPDAIQGRMNATIRTTNRIVFFFGALDAGVLATWLGYAASLGVAAAVFAVAALVIVFSPLRNARHGEAGV